MNKKEKDMMRKMLISIGTGLIGAAIAIGVYINKEHIPGIWKNKNNGSIYAFVVLGLVAGVLLAYIFQNDKEIRKK